MKSSQTEATNSRADTLFPFLKHGHDPDRSGLFLTTKLTLSRVSNALEIDSEGHDRRNESIVPFWALSVIKDCGNVHIPNLFQATHWPDRASTLYLPKRSLALVIAFSVSHGDDPHVQNFKV